MQDANSRVIGTELLKPLGAYIVPPYAVSGFRVWDSRIPFQILPFQILVLYWPILLSYFSILPFDMEMFAVPLCTALHNFSLILRVFTAKRCSWGSKETLNLDMLAVLEMLTMGTLGGGLNLNYKMDMNRLKTRAWIFWLKEICVSVKLTKGSLVMVNLNCQLCWT